MVSTLTPTLNQLERHQMTVQGLKQTKNDLGVATVILTLPLMVGNAEIPNVTRGDKGNPCTITNTKG